MENNLQDIFVPYEESLELKELGFNEECLAFHWQRSISRGLFIGNPREKYDIIINAPTWEQAFKFFRDKCKLDSHIVYDGFNNDGKLLKCYSFDIIKGFTDKNVLTERSNNFEKVLDFSEQDIPGNHINSEMFEEGLFKFYGYKTYEEARLECLKQLIKIVKDGK